MKKRIHTPTPAAILELEVIECRDVPSVGGFSSLLGQVTETIQPAATGAAVLAAHAEAVARPAEAPTDVLQEIRGTTAGVVTLLRDAASTAIVTAVDAAATVEAAPVVTVTATERALTNLSNTVADRADTPPLQPPLAAANAVNVNGPTIPAMTASPFVTTGVADVPTADGYASRTTVPTAVVSIADGSGQPPATIFLAEPYAAAAAMTPGDSDGRGTSSSVPASGRAATPEARTLPVEIAWITPLTVDDEPSHGPPSDGVPAHESLPILSELPTAGGAVNRDEISGVGGWAESKLDEPTQTPVRSEPDADEDVAIPPVWVEPAGVTGGQTATASAKLAAASSPDEDVAGEMGGDDESASDDAGPSDGISRQRLLTGLASFFGLGAYWASRRQSATRPQDDQDARADDPLDLALDV